MLNNYSFVTGIIQGNSCNTAEPWAYGRYINCLFNPGFGFHIGKLSDVWKAHRDCISIVNRKYGVIPPHKLVSHMKKLLDEGYYIMRVLDEQYIPGMAAYQRRRYLHDSLLIGYNEEKQVFLLFGRLSDNNLHLTEVPYENIEKAVSKGSWSFVLKYEPKNKDILDISEVKAELSHYLYSSPSISKGKGTKYGIEGVMALCDFLIAQYREQGYMDFRFTRGLLEQKSLMHSMCMYLHNNGYYLPKEVLKLSKCVFDSASIIHILTLKALLQSEHGKYICTCLRKQFVKLATAEKQYIPILLECLHDQKIDT